MNYAAVLAAVFSTVLVSGCAVLSGHPQNAEEFRKAVPGSMTAKVETFEVNRPFTDVAKTFKEKAPRCLNVRVKTVSQTGASYQVTRYKPTVLANGKKAELDVQFHHEQGVLNVTKEPEGGYYLLVADAYPVGEGRTRVDLYRPSLGYKALIKAVKGWATGNNLGCPDLTKV
jgi:hypothetical protein